MTDKLNKHSNSGGAAMAACAWFLLIGIGFYVIVAEPDEGGIWDGYVPTWLGGAGQNGGEQYDETPLAQPPSMQP
ncbi:MAG: hypothetical protein AAFY22_02435 [Pseudomonadota bacterium]